MIKTTIKTKTKHMIYIQMLENASSEYFRDTGLEATNSELNESLAEIASEKDHILASLLKTQFVEFEN
jgi:hypothetical protein